MTNADEVSEGARVLSKRGASRGGKSRAERLSPEERSDIARHAAAARWGTTVAEATHTGKLRIGDRTISCAVLEDGTRVINQGTLLTALGRARRPKGGGERGEAGTVLFAGNLRPFIPPDLEQALANPITYTQPAGGRALGYPAEILPAVCEVYLDADESEKGVLKSQVPALRAAQILLRGLARVGVTALIDEATGYQEVRARDELQRILEAYVHAEFRPWVKTFPDAFFQEIYRLQGWEYRPGTSKRTPLVGKLINKYVYEQLPAGVLDELRRVNPKTDKGWRAHKHHQHLTPNTGNVHLDRQIATVTTLMRIAYSQAEFEQLFERAFPPPQARLPLQIEDVVGKETS
ncbi:MAG: hypothetical protein QOE58_554 [Actinomycetota bacterium]|nr:hypothetical protein [Actinomycetota bacterium]